MKSVLKGVIWLYVAAAGAYVFYGWYSYTGLYRFAAEWQLEHYGSFSVKLSAIVPLLILLIPGFVLARLFGVQDQLRGVNSGAGSPGMFALLGLVGLAVAVGAGWFGYEKTTETVEVESLDLSRNDTPRSTHVAITGVAHTEYTIEFETKSAGRTTLDRYIPLTPAAWRRGEPLVYFLKTNATVYLPPGGGRMFEFSQRTPPFPMTTQPGVLVRDGLPGPVGERYRKNNIALASPPIMLDLAPDAEVMPFFVTAGVSGLLGFCMLVAAGATAARRRRLAQT
jgi:hypothetical protein